MKCLAGWEIIHLLEALIVLNEFSFMCAFLSGTKDKSVVPLCEGRYWYCFYHFINYNRSKIQILPVLKDI